MKRGVGGGGVERGSNEAHKDRQVILDPRFYCVGRNNYWSP